MQVAVIEFARHLAGLEGAMSTEFDRATPHPVIGLITEWQDKTGDTEQRDEESELGGTMRLGAQRVTLAEGSLARARTAVPVSKSAIVTATNSITTIGSASARRAYDFPGCRSTTWSRWSNCPTTRGSWRRQFHPEFTSNPRDGHPLFKSFISAVRQHREGDLPEAVEA